MFYSTLADALADIAGRSFYEGATITPDGAGYRVTNASALVDSLNDYGDGVEWPLDTLDRSREHEPAEYYATAHHIEHNLPNAVSAIKDGRAVSFHYLLIDTLCAIDTPDYMEYHAVGLCDECEGNGSTITGWALVAYAA